MGKARTVYKTALAVPVLCPHCHEIVWGWNKVYLRTTQIIAEHYYKDVIAISEPDWLTPSEIYERLLLCSVYISKGSLTSILKYLCELGLVKKKPGGYSVGPKMSQVLHEQLEKL